MDSEKAPGFMHCIVIAVTGFRTGISRTDESLPQSTALEHKSVIITRLFLSRRSIVSLEPFKRQVVQLLVEFPSLGKRGVCQECRFCL